MEITPTPDAANPRSASRMEVHRLLADPPGGRSLLLGNEAIVRGALEAGVGFATGYPGTPSSEVTDSFAELSDEAGLVFEYAVNEKICLELAFGASLAGARAICAMKHLGLIVAGDPSCLTSPNEQDQRHLGRMLHFSRHATIDSGIEVEDPRGDRALVL